MDNFGPVEKHCICKACRSGMLAAFCQHVFWTAEPPGLREVLPAAKAGRIEGEVLFVAKPGRIVREVRLCYNGQKDDQLCQKAIPLRERGTRQGGRRGAGYECVGR